MGYSAKWVRDKLGVTRDMIRYYEKEDLIPIRSSRNPANNYRDYSDEDIERIWSIKLLIGIGFGPIFPSILHSVPDRFGAEYSADLTGFHMGGAYAIGFAVQLIFGFIATATTFKITPFVLLGFIILLFAVNEFTIKTIKKSRSIK